MSKGSTFNDLPPVAKILIVAAAVAAVGYTVYVVQKAAKKQEENKGNKNEGKAVDSDLSALVKQGKGPTLSESQMAAIANKLFAAMDGYGTDNKQIIVALQAAKNDADILGIIKAYGTRTLSTGRFNPEPNVPQTLPAAISTEVPASGYGILNYALIAVNPIAGLAAISNGDIGINTINSLLESKKINFRF